LNVFFMSGAAGKTWSIIGRVAVMVAGALIVPGRAQASCGDYVHFGKDPSKSTEAPHSQNAPAHSAPQCHGQKPLPPAPPTVLRLPEVACLLSLPSPAHGEPRSFLNVSNIRSRIHKPFLVFHPPRSIAPDVPKQT
jgi:hypothetical protein